MKVFSRRTFLLIGVATAGLFAVTLKPWKILKPRTSLTEDDWLTLSLYLDTLIPKTDLTPSASEAGVVDFLRRMLKNDFPSFKLVPSKVDWNDFYLKLAERLDQKGEDVFEKAFRDLSSEQRIKVVSDLSGGSTAQVGYRIAGTGPKDVYPDRELFSVSRVQALQGYFSEPKYGGNKNYGPWQAIKHVCHFNYPNPPVSCPPHVM
jgi:gluconate 2-dehydrogenase gamma chain